MTAQEPLQELLEVARELWGPDAWATFEHGSCCVGHINRFGTMQGLIHGGSVEDMIPLVRKLLASKLECEERKKNNGV